LTVHSVVCILVVTVGLGYDTESGVGVWLPTQWLLFCDECHINRYFTCLNISCNNCQNAEVKCPEFYCMVLKLLVIVNLVHLTYQKFVSYLDAKQKILSSFRDLNL